MTKTCRPRATTRTWPGRSGAAACVVLLLLVACPVSGHGAAPPTDQYTRVLHDHNDDCGGDGDTSDCGGTHDLIALDVREAWREDLGDVLVFRFIMDEGDGGALRDTLTFHVAGGERAFELRETEGGFAGDFDDVGDRVLLGDGTRFAVEATVALDTLGAALGSRLTEFRVEATRDGQPGDHMPGGYSAPTGPVADPPQGERQTNFRLAALTLRGPIQYGTFALDPPEVQLRAGSETLVLVHVENRLDDLSETFLLEAVADDGVSARFHDLEASDGSGYSETYTLTLGAGRQGIVHLALEGSQAGATGNVTVTMTSHLGGRVVQTLPYGVERAPPSSGTGTPSATGSTSGGPSGSGAATGEGAPALLLPAVMLMLFWVALVGRRRWQR